MNGAKKLAKVPATGMARREERVRREYHELWFALARKDWRSVVFVPADSGGSAAGVATSLAQVGKHLHDLPVMLFIMANPADYWPAMEMVSAAATSVQGQDQADEAAPLDYGAAVQVVTAAASRQGVGRQDTGKVIVAIEPVITEPLGLAVTQAADAVVLYIETGRTRLSSTRRTIELIGRERIAGCFIDSSHRPQAPVRS